MASVQEFYFHGLITAVVAPFDSFGNLKLDDIKKYVQHVKDFGIQGVFVNGSNGEGNSMSVEERKTVAEAWIKEGKPEGLMIFIHIGAGNISDSKELAKHAENIGAHAIGCVAPTYHKPETIEDYVEYMQLVAASAPKTPFYLYDVEQKTGITLDVRAFMRLGKDRIPTLRGVKHTSIRFDSMQTIHMEHGGKYQVLLGNDDLYLEGLSLGLTINVMNSYNGHVLNRMKKAFDAGNLELARKEQMRAIMVNSLRLKHEFNGPGGSKVITDMLGLKTGQARSPLSKIPEANIQAFKKDMEAIGYFRWGVNAHYDVDEPLVFV